VDYPPGSFRILICSIAARPNSATMIDVPCSFNIFIVLLLVTIIGGFKFKGLPALFQVRIPSILIAYIIAPSVLLYFSVSSWDIIFVACLTVTDHECWTK